MSLGDSNDPGWTGYDQKLAERIAGEAYDIAQLASIRHRDPALALSIAEQSGKEHDRTFLASGAPRITIKETKP